MYTLLPPYSQVHFLQTHILAGFSIKQGQVQRNFCCINANICGPSMGLQASTSHHCCTTNGLPLRLQTASHFYLGCLPTYEKLSVNEISALNFTKLHSHFF